MKRFFVVLALFAVLAEPVLAEKSYRLDAGIAEAARGLSSRLAGKTKVVILDIKTDNERVEAYIVDGLTSQLLQNDRLVVVDRENLATIKKELSFQMSGDVSDESSQRIGAMLGAESIITGSFEPLDDKYRLSLKAVKVETAEIQYLSAMTIIPDGGIDALYGRKTVASRDVADFSGRLVCSAINPLIGLGSFIQGDSSGGGTVVFWEVVGGAGLYFGYTKENDFFTIAGGCAFGGAVIYSIIRPWTYKRVPSVARALDNVRVAYTGDAVSAGYTIRF
jgi:hypothetical protein